MASSAGYHDWHQAEQAQVVINQHYQQMNVAQSAVLQEQRFNQQCEFNMHQMQWQLQHERQQRELHQTFASFMCHELRNPLTGQLGLLGVDGTQLPYTDVEKQRLMRLGGQVRARLPRGRPRSRRFLLRRRRTKMLKRPTKPQTRLARRRGRS